MPRNMPKRCKDCGKPRTARRHISRHGLCVACGARRQRQAADAQAKAFAELARQRQIARDRIIT